MKKISKLKLNAIASAEMAKREMEVLKGGFDGPFTCGCGCHFADSGGASVVDNAWANAYARKSSEPPYAMQITLNWTTYYYTIE